MLGLHVAAKVIGVYPSNDWIAPQLREQHLPPMAFTRREVELLAYHLSRTAHYPVEDTGVVGNQFLSQLRIPTLLRHGDIETDELQTPDEAEALVVRVGEFVQVEHKVRKVVVLRDVAAELPVHHGLAAHYALEGARTPAAERPAVFLSTPVENLMTQRQTRTHAFIAGAHQLGVGNVADALRAVHAPRCPIDDALAVTATAYQQEAQLHPRCILALVGKVYLAAVYKTQPQEHLKYHTAVLVGQHLVKEVVPLHTAGHLLVLVRMVVGDVEPRRELLEENRLLATKYRGNIQHAVLKRNEVTRLHHRIVVPDGVGERLGNVLVANGRNNLQVLHNLRKRRADELFADGDVYLPVEEVKVALTVKNWGFLAQLAHVPRQRKELLLIALARPVAPRAFQRVELIVRTRQNLYQARINLINDYIVSHISIFVVMFAAVSQQP